MGQARGVEPQAHGILAFSEDDDVAHAFDALQRIFQIDVNIVADEEAVIAIVIGIEAGGEDEARAALADADAGGIYLGGQPALHVGHAILNINGRDVNVAANVEYGADTAGAVVPAAGGDVLQSFDSVDLLLHRRSDRSFHHRRAS